MLARTPLRTLAIEWLKTKNPNEGYRWNDGNICACAQLAHNLGRFKEWRIFVEVLSGTEALNEISFGDKSAMADWKHLNIVAARGGAQDHTFGKLLERLQGELL